MAARALTVLNDCLSRTVEVILVDARLISIESRFSDPRSLSFGKLVSWFASEDVEGEDRRFQGVSEGSSCFWVHNQVSCSKVHIFLRVPVGESKSHLKLWMAMSATVEEIAGVASGSIVCHFEGLNVDKVENALGQILHIEDNVEKEKTICCAEKVTTSTKLGTEISVTNLKCHRSLDKSATFSSLSRVPLVETARKNANTAADRSLSFPCSFKLVSAMKVSREAEGETTPKTKMNVSWAPGVYDPPVTSVSHSVKSYNQRSYLNNKKKDRPHKHKNRKGKGTREGNNEKKHQQRQSDPSRTRSLTPTSSGEFPSGGFGESEALVAEGSVGGSSQDMKCGNSSFLRASLGSVVYSVAEV